MRHNGFPVGRFISLLLALSLSACVSARKYDDLERDYAASSAKVANLEKKLGVASSENSQLTTSVAEMKSALEEAQKRKEETDKRLAEFKELTEKFKSLVDAGKLRVKVVDGRMLVQLQTDVLFGSGSARLSAAGRAGIREVGAVLAGLENRSFQVEGHTDNVPIKSATFPSNWELAAARAITVLNTLVEAGMPKERVSAASFGETHAAAPNATAEGRAANRRIEIVVVPDLSSLPGFEELNRLSPNSAPAPTPSPAKAE
jgi:chemotaxis protein MotB